MQKLKPYLIGAGIAVPLIALGLIVWFSVEGWWSIVVDIVLVIAALMSFVMLAALAGAVFFLTRTILGVKSEVMPVLESLKSTTSAVRESAKTASAFGVNPAVRTASVLAGAGEVAAVVLGRGHANKRSEKRQKRRQEIEREMAARGELNGYR